MYAPQPPILFNALKHHAGYLRALIAATPTDISLSELRRLLLPIGAAQLDLYTGSRTPRQLAMAVTDYLQQHQLLDYACYSRWIWQGDDYRLLTLPDSSRWVLRLGQQPEGWVHLHPARYSPHSQRLKAHSLKTALALLIKGVSLLGEHQALNTLRQGLALPPLAPNRQYPSLEKAYTLLQQ